MSPDAAPAFGFGSRLDLAHALAGEPEDLADVAKGELFVLEDAVAQLENRAFLERELFEGMLNSAMLTERGQVLNAAAVDLLRHSRSEVVELPEDIPHIRIRVRVEEQGGELTLADRQLLIHLLRTSAHEPGRLAGQ